MRRWAGALVLLAVACHGDAAKKKPVTRADFQSVNDAVLKTLNGGKHTADERKRYVVEQLGAPHRTDGDTAYWYTPVVDCWYFQMSADGWSSWGVGATEDCKKYAVSE